MVATKHPSLRSFTGKQKAAALLIALGPEMSATVLQHLRDEDIERLTWEIFSIGQLHPDTRDEVLAEMYSNVVAQEYVSIGGIEYAEEMLERALGKSRAQDIVQRLSMNSHAIPFAFLRDVDPTQLGSFLRNEHPQTIALILAYLPAERASLLLSGIPADIQSDVAVRIATMDRTTPEVVHGVETVLKKKLANVLTPHQEFAKAGGVEALVELLKQVDRGTEKAILDNLERNDPKLADEIKKRMFVFENMSLLDDRSIQRVLREVEVKDLGIALKGASEELRQRIFANMSERAAQMLEEDMASIGPLRLRNVEEAQGRIVQVIRRLDDAEEIVISRGGEDEILV